MSLPQSNNYTIHFIVLYWLFCFAPHIYSATLLTAPKDIKTKDPATKLQPGDPLYNFSNPHGKSAAEYYAKVLDGRTFQKWERARSSHNNMLESSSFTIGAFIIGLIAKLPSSYMNTACILYFLTRLGYLFAYIGTERGVVTVSRTVMFGLGQAVLCSVLWEAGKEIMVGEY